MLIPFGFHISRLIRLGKFTHRENEKSGLLLAGESVLKTVDQGTQTGLNDATGSTVSERSVDEVAEAVEQSNTVVVPTEETQRSEQVHGLEVLRTSF